MKKEKMMSEEELKRKPDDSNVTEFIEKGECNPSRSEEIQINIEMSECKHSSRVNSDEALQQSEPSTQILSTNASEDQDKDDEEDFIWKKKLKNIQYVRLGCKTYVDQICRVFDEWEMVLPDVFFSVLSDSDCDTDFDSDTGLGKLGHEAIEANAKESLSDVRRTFCRSLVEVVATTNAWIITGGLNKGVDQLIGNEVKQRLANQDKIPRAVLGISNWECIAKKKNLLKDSHGPDDVEFDIPTVLSLNQHHTHLLLVDYGTQKSGREYTLREMVEEGLDKRLIYVLVGGRINAIHSVERALANQLPVIIAMGTGGAADIISQAVSCEDGVILEYLQEIAEKLFNRLEELLIAESIPATEVRQVINNIKTKIKLDLLFEIVELLDQTRISEGGAQQFKVEIATLVKTTTNELLAGIKDHLISKQTSIDGSNHPAADAEFETVNRMRAVFEQILVVNGISPQNADRAVNDLGHEVLNEMLTKVNLAFTDLKAIRTHHQKDLLIKFDVTSKGKKSISCAIVEALKKVKWNAGSELYMLVSEWDNEAFFRQLLLDSWMRRYHAIVFKELLGKDNTKYVKLMMEHISNKKWLTQGPVVEDFKENKLYAKLLKKESKADNEDKRYRLKGKMLFIWCVLKGMRETAMLFWEQGQDCLAMALVAYDESKKLKKDLVNREKGYDEMENQIQFFGTLALDFMSKCHACDQDYTLDVLFEEVKDLGNIVPYDIAIKSNFEAFFCVDAMQDLVNDIWVKQIKYHRKCKYIPLLLSEACPLLAPALLDFEFDKKDKKQEAKKCECECNYFKKVRIFMGTPLVKFTYRFISYIAYLTLFSTVMLTDFRTKISPSEIALTIWTAILIIEEVKQVISDISGYKSNGWNYFDIGTLILYIIGFTLRMIYHGDPTICPDCLYVARIILAFSLMVSFFRALQFLSIFDSIGPTIYMIRHLVADLVSILLIFAVFISAYGVVSNVILYPNQPLNAQLLKDVFYDAWWSVIQQFNREDALGSNCNKNNNVSAIYTAEYCSNTSDDNIDYVQCKENRCPANNWIVSVLLAFYALLTCIMLLNVLIAMFNATFSSIKEKQKDVSKLQRYGLVYEYCSESMVPPPLCVIAYPYLIIKYLHYQCKYRLCHIKCPKIGNANKDATTEENTDDREPWQKWELTIAADFYRESKDKDGKQRWPVARIKSETYNKFDEKPWIRHITEQIHNQMKEEQSREETDSKDIREIEEGAGEEIDSRVSQEVRANPESTDAIDAIEKKGN